MNVSVKLEATCMSVILSVSLSNCVGNLHHNTHSMELLLLINPFPNNKFLTLPISDFADNSFKSDDNGRKFLKRVEKTTYEQFLLFSVFLSLVLQTHRWVSATLS